MKTNSLTIAAAILLTATAACKDPTAGKTAAKVEEAAGKATDAAKDSMKAGADKLKNAAGDMKDAAAGAAGNMKDAAAGAAKSAMDYVTEDDKAALKAGIDIASGKDSTIGFTGSKVTGSHSGSFEKWTGKLAVDDKGMPKAVSIEIDMASVTTDAEKLTGHLATGDFFAVEKFPKAMFQSTKISPMKDKKLGHMVEGYLTMRGVTKKVTFPAEVNTSKKFSLTSEFSINRKDWGIVYPGKPDDLIRDGVLMKLNITAAM